MKKLIWNFAFLFFIFFISGCAASSMKQSIADSLPEKTLSFYNDSFDQFREDLWEKGLLLFEKEQYANIKIADMEFAGGVLVIRTKTGNISQGALGSKFFLKGDFDVQIDCHIKFLDQIPDQILVFAVVETNKCIRDSKMVIIQVSDSIYTRGKKFVGVLYKGKWTFYSRGWKEISDTFNGTLRIKRIGKSVHTSFRKQGDLEWVYLYSFHNISENVRIGFGIQNFRAGDKTVSAKYPLEASFDNFKINAAQGIIEPEI